MRQKKLWEQGIKRRCHSTHECCICGMRISLGQDYWDRGTRSKAHVLCGIAADSSQSADVQPTRESKRRQKTQERKR